MQIIRPRGVARRVSLAATAAAVIVGIAGCGLQPSNSSVLIGEPGSVQAYESLEGVEITVGAKDFTEQLVLGNMMSTLLATAGATVTNRSNTAGSNTVREASLSGDFDITPEYTGTGWVSYLGHAQPIRESPEAQWKAVAEEDERENDLVWLPPSPMDNTYAFAMGPEAAERLDISTLSDLRSLPQEELTFCVESEFATRDDGFVPMLKAYGLTPQQIGEEVRLGTGQIYQATADGECNFGEVFTTDGRIPALELTVLEDDKQFFPLYNMTQVVNGDLLDDHPEIAEIFEQVNPKITNEVMLELNAKVDVDGEDPGEVAFDWLVDEGFITE